MVDDVIKLRANQRRSFRSGVVPPDSLTDTFSSISAGGKFGQIANSLCLTGG